MAKDGAHVPDLETRVRPAPHLTFYWNAFYNLSSDRQRGFGAGPIPWSSIDRYAIRYQVDQPEQFELFVRLVRAMDSVFLKDAAEKSAKT